MREKQSPTRQGDMGKKLAGNLRVYYFSIF